MLSCEVPIPHRCCVPYAVHIFVYLTVLFYCCRGKEAEDKQEIYMYEASSGKVTKLKGELSSAFVDVADSNSQSQDLEGLSSH